MTMPTFFTLLKISIKDLKGGLGKFKIFLVSLFLGVLTISLVGSFEDAIQAGLQKESSTILGGDVSLTLPYREASENEFKIISKITEDSAKIISFRSMVSVSNSEDLKTSLVQVKAIDDLYPL